MARMVFFGLMAATVLLSPLCNGSGPPYPELNPALGKYQNALVCLPIDELWHSVYRNYEYDPLFGGTALCGTYSSLGFEENGGFPMKIQFRHWSVNVTLTPAASQGYDVDNLQYFQKEGENVSHLVYIGYVDCDKCVLFRNSYVSKKACTLLVRENTRESVPVCCQFVFDLLCGTGRKYYTYTKQLCSK